LNFTALPNDNLGDLSTWPTGQSKPLVSTLNAANQAVVANAAIVPAGSNVDITVFASDPAQFVLDISGYFATPSYLGLHLYTLPPCRVLDTRFTKPDSPFTGKLVIPVAGQCGIPNTAAAAVLNATVVPQAPLGYLTLWQDGVTQPLASILNAQDAAVTSNMAIVPIGTNGSIDAFASSSTHLILDVSGYFAP